MKSERVKVRLAWAKATALAPVQEGLEADRHQVRVVAAERKSHEPAIAAIQPIIIAAMARQF
jgi:hypothetical protein